MTELWPYLSTISGPSSCQDPHGLHIGTRRKNKIAGFLGITGIRLHLADQR